MHDHTLDSRLTRIEHGVRIADAKLDLLIGIVGGSKRIELSDLIAKLRASELALSAAVSSSSSGPVPHPQQQESRMPNPNPTLDALAAQVTATTTVEQSAIDALNGIAGRIQAAVDAAIANGATAEQLAPVTDEVAALQAKTSALADAIAANT